MLGALPLVPEASVANTIAKRATMADVPSIRGLPAAEGIKQAQAEPHLIPAGNQSAGYYVGGPQDVHSPADLAARRSDVDAYIAADPRGWDWYDRYRAGMNRATGGDPLAKGSLFDYSKLGQVPDVPQSEQGYVLKEANSALAGMPKQAGMENQHDAFLAAINADNPNLMQLGDKTGEYAGLVNPNRAGLPSGATGVNDFRHARGFGYGSEELAVDKKGKVNLSPTQHTFLDYETALAAPRRPTQTCRQIHGRESRSRRRPGCARRLKPCRTRPARPRRSRSAGTTRPPFRRQTTASRCRSPARPTGRHSPTGHLAQKQHQMNANTVVGGGWPSVGLKNPKPPSFGWDLIGQPATGRGRRARLQAASHAVARAPVSGDSVQGEPGRPKPEHPGDGREWQDLDGMRTAPRRPVQPGGQAAATGTPTNTGRWLELLQEPGWR